MPKQRSKSRRTAKRWIRSAADELAVQDGCYYDEQAGLYVVEFFEVFLCHTLGQWAGKPFTLLPWQRDDVVMPLFGWKRADGSRRFRRAYIEVPKKNGKSTLCGGLALYLLVADGEPRAQIYGAAADREQAGIVFTEAANMVQVSEELSERLEVVRSTKRLVDPITASFYHAISADAYSNEGLNAHGIIFDELHAQKNRDLWDALRYATASRRQPLSIAITTAGFDRESICYEQHQYAQNILSGAVHDNSLLAFIRAADQDANWEDPKVWKQANPSFGITLDADQMADDCREAIASPRKESAFRRYRLNQWVGHAENWISPADWQKGAEPFDPAMLEGRECFVGIDLARKRDLAAVVLLFEKDEEYFLLPRFFLPEECLKERERHDHVSYSAWVKEGLLTLTDGEVIDYRFIREQVNSDAKRYRIQEIGYDPWNAEQLCNHQLGQEDGFDVVEVKPVINLLGPVASEFEKLVREGRIRHGGCPVLSWMIAGCTVREDHNQNILPSKKNSTSRIDGVVAAIIALSRALAGNRHSVYEKRGVIMF